MVQHVSSSPRSPSSRVSTLKKFNLGLEIIVSSFQCDHCGYKNSEVSFGGQIADFGVRYELKVVNAVNMNRNVVKSEHATIRIPELDLEIPPMTQKGSVNTIEGFLMKTIEGLSDL